jgi:hypothetical protein
MVSVASGWHTHLGLLIDHFCYLPARPFWSTKMRMAVEYERRFADLPVRLAWIEHDSRDLKGEIW